MGFAKDGWERQMWADVYKLAEKHWKVPLHLRNNDEYWDSMISEMDAFAAKYDQDRFAAHLAVLIIQHAEDPNR